MINEHLLMSSICQMEFHLDQSFRHLLNVYPEGLATKVNAAMRLPVNLAKAISCVQNGHVDHDKVVEILRESAERMGYDYWEIVNQLFYCGTDLKTLDWFKP